MVARAIPAVWELVSPAGALRARLAGAVSALRPLLAGLDANVAAAADLLGKAAGELDCAGRVLAAANAALPLTQDPAGLVAGGHAAARASRRRALRRRGQRGHRRLRRTRAALRA